MAAEVPSAQKVILRARSVDRRQLLAVDKKHVVAFAPPLVLILQHRHGYADEVSAPGRFHPDVVAATVKILLSVHLPVRLPLIRCPVRRSGLTILRMEIELIYREGL